MKNLKLLRKLKGASQQDVADFVGVTQSGYQRYETGQREPPIEILKKLSEYFGVSIPELISDSANPQWLSFEQPTPDFVSITTVKIPIIGHIRAGCDTLAEQSVEGYMEAAPDLLKRWPDAAAIKIWGNSMEPELREGDCVIISRQAETKSGDIAVVCVNGNEGAVKRVRWDDAGLDIIPSNPAYGTQHFSSEDVERLPVVIVARVVRIIRDL